MLDLGYVTDTGLYSVLLTTFGLIIVVIVIYRYVWLGGVMVTA